MYIKYVHSNGKILVANILSGVTPEQAAEAMGLAPGTWEEITDAEAAELQKPTADELEAQAAIEAAAESAAILTAKMQRQLVQAEDFTPAEFATLARAGLFPVWMPGESYTTGDRLVFDAVVYEVQQPVTAQGHQPPGSAGMLAIYRPISADPDTGAEPDGSRDNPYGFISGMDVFGGSYYAFEGLLYLAKADMIPCVWAPGTPGLWQWELVG